MQTHKDAHRRRHRHRHKHRHGHENTTTDLYAKENRIRKIENIDLLWTNDAKLLSH